MKENPKDADWKRFRDIVPKLRERYLSAQNKALASILESHELSEAERFWRIKEQTGEVAKILRACLDGHSRSKMEFFMIVMFNHGMLTEDDLSEFSEQVRERVLN